MNLDPRIIEGKRPLTCFDVEEAKQFIGKECYLSNSFSDYADLNNVTAKRILDYVSNTRIPYGSNPAGIYCYCLPCEWIEEPEKKYRAFTLNEFLEKYDVGDLVKIRRNGYEEVEHAMFTGYITGPDESGDKNLGEDQIIIGGMRYSFAYLFEYYELFSFMGHWQPFGVIDESQE